MGKVEDGIVLMYNKDGVIYPVSMSNEQYNMLTIMVASICNPLNVLTKFPQGSSVNLIDSIKAEVKKNGTDDLR
jgi:hypothetical protein